MPTITLTDQNQTEILNGGAPVVIDFWASWCGPCTRFSPIFEEASDRHDTVVFAKVDIEAEEQLAIDFGVMAIPTIVVVRGGEVVSARAGALTAAGLDQLVTSLL